MGRVRRGRVLVGPHRDDLVLTVEADDPVLRSDILYVRGMVQVFRGSLDAAEATFGEAMAAATTPAT